MSYNNENLLFLAMAQGGQLTPEMMQMMQQSGQLPQLNMGASLNDIQKMNMKQQSHYGNGMFRYGGVPYRADGGEQQESVDQQFLSPEKKYSGRVEDFLKQLKSKAMSVVQDEMLNTANDYDREAMAIDMQNQMRYGGMYAPGGTTFGQNPSLDMSGVNAADTWLKAAQANQTDMTKDVAKVASAATGLKGFFNNSGADKFTNNPYNTSYIKKGFITDVATGDRDRIRFDVGGPNDVSLPRAMTPEQFAENAKLEANAKAMGWVNPDGTADVAGYSAVGPDGKQYGYGPKHPSQLAKSTKTKKDKTAPKLTPEQEAAAKAKTEQEARIAEEVKKAEEDKKKKEEETKTGTKTEDKKEGDKTETKTTTDVGDGMDYWRMLADPNSDRTGGMYQLDKNGNPIPAAFYDPNMRISNMTADYRVPVSNLFRRKEKDRAGVMKRASFDFTYSPQSQNVITSNPAANQNPAAPAANNNGTPTWANQFFPQQPEKLMGTDYQGAPYKPQLIDSESWGRGAEEDAGYQQQVDNWRPGMPVPVLPKGFNIGPGNFTPGAQPVQQPVVPLPGPLTPKQARQQGRQQLDAATQAAVDKINAVNQQGSQPTPNAIPTNAPMPQFGPAQMFNTPAYSPTLNLMNGFSAGPTKEYGGLHKFVKGGVDPTVGIDKPWVPETVTKHIDYDYGKKNPFLVPGMMAGLEMIGAGLRNRESDKMTAEAMGKFSADQVYSTMPQKSGARGDYSMEGYLRPDDMNPSPQFSGYNFQSNYAAEGGEMSEGDEMYLDEDTINAILAAGGQIEYLD